MFHSISELLNVRTDKRYWTSEISFTKEYLMEYRPNYSWILLLAFSVEGCSSAAGSLPFLYGPVSCMISSDCRTVDCCLNVPLIKRSFHFVMYIDLCARKMTLQIEKLKMELSLLDAKLREYHLQWLCMIGRHVCKG